MRVRALFSALRFGCARFAWPSPINSIIAGILQRRLSSARAHRRLRLHRWLKRRRGCWLEDGNRRLRSRRHRSSAQRGDRRRRLANFRLYFCSPSRFIAFSVYDRARGMRKLERRRAFAESQKKSAAKRRSAAISNFIGSNWRCSGQTREFRKTRAHVARNIRSKSGAPSRPRSIFSYQQRAASRRPADGEASAAATAATADRAARRSASFDAPVKCALHLWLASSMAPPPPPIGGVAHNTAVSADNNERGDQAASRRPHRRRRSSPPLAATAHRSRSPPLADQWRKRRSSWPSLAAN